MVSSTARVLAPTHLPSAQPPKVLDRVREAIRARHYSLRTEEAYVGWVHQDVRTTMIYTHVLNRGGRGVLSPVDKL